MGAKAGQHLRRDGGTLGRGHRHEGALAGVAGLLGLGFLVALRLRLGFLVGLAPILVGLALTFVPLPDRHRALVVAGLQDGRGEAAGVEVEPGSPEAREDLAGGLSLERDQIATQFELGPGLLEDAFDARDLALERLALLDELRFRVLRRPEAPRGFRQRGALGGRLGRGGGFFRGRGRLLGGLGRGGGLFASHLGEGGVEALVDGSSSGRRRSRSRSGRFRSGSRGGGGSIGGFGHHAACAGAAGAPSGGGGEVEAPASGAGAASLAARSAITRTSSSQSRSSSRASSGTSQRVHCW